MKEEIIIIGGGGHCSSVIDSLIGADEFKIRGIIDTNEKIGQYIHGIEVIGEDRDLQKYYALGVRNACIAIGSVGNTRLREKIYSQIKKIGYNTPNVIDCSANISKTAVIGEGNYIGKNVVINADTQIRDNCIVNTGSIVEHNCIIDNFVHIAPGSVLCGNVYIGRYSHIGANSTIIQGIQIGKRTIIGAGSVVVKNIREYKIAFGNPCKEIKDNE